MPPHYYPKAFACTARTRSPEALLMSKVRYQKLSSRQQEWFEPRRSRPLPYMRTLWIVGGGHPRAAVEKAECACDPGPIASRFRRWRHPTRFVYERSATAADYTKKFAPSREGRAGAVRRVPAWTFPGVIVGMHVRSLCSAPGRTCARCAIIIAWHGAHSHDPRRGWQVFDATYSMTRQAGPSPWRCC